MNVYDVRVLSCDAGSHAWLSIGRSRIAARAWPGIVPRERSRISIRPEDVVLCADPPGRVSARNVLPGHVASLRASPEGVYVTVEVGFELTALVTRAAVAELLLRRGAAVFAIAKATAVVPHMDVRPRLAVSVVGTNGSIESRQIAFLRMLESLGSMVSAARAFGVSYRTAWLWVQQSNRAWGQRLVERAHGGRGGGGAALTAEGRAVLRRVTEAERVINP